MSHIVKQVGVVEIKNLEFLRRACEFVTDHSLKCNLKLDMSKKEARYWQDNVERCDGVITFGRALTDEEKSRSYEIALKADGKGNYGMFADTHAGDREITNRINAIQAAYHIEVQKETALAEGFSIVGQVEVAPGKFELEVTKA